MGRRKKEDPYKYMRDQARNNLVLNWQHIEGHPGTIQITASIPCCPCPMGVVWITFPMNGTIESQSSFVDARVRRCGIRTAIHNYMLDTFPDIYRIVAASGSYDGQHWMEATGFKQNKKGDWIFTRKKRKA